MKILVTRTGGYAGLSEDVATVDTEALPPDAARRLERLVNEIGFFDLPAEIEPDEVGADLFRYDVAVSDAGRRHRVAFVDSESPRAVQLRRLVDALSGQP